VVQVVSVADQKFTVATEAEIQSRIDRRWNWTVRWVSLLVAAVLGGSVFFIVQGCQHQMTRDGSNAQLCIGRGGSWVDGDCVMPRDR